MKKWSLLLVLMTLAFSASANFCKKAATDRALQEARLLERDTSLVTPAPNTSPDYIGLRSYNADVITCNRKRDSKGGKIEKAINAGHRFADDLPAVYITGRYAYYSTAPIRYAYQLRREKGVWIVTIPMRFFWPTRKRDKIDIPMQLVNDLGDRELNRLCREGGTVFDPNGKDVSLGYIPVRTSSKQKGTDLVNRGEEACRVYRSQNVRGINILVHLRQFFARALKRVWDRPGFRIEPVLLDLGEGSEAQRNAWKKGKLIWNIRMNLRPRHRTSYKRWVFKWRPMYSAIPAHVIGHEFGHWMGLDDEYGWGPDWSRTQRDCNKRTGGWMYIMCTQWASEGTTLDEWRNGAKAVYPWIVTRRYAIGKPPSCKKDSDCGQGNYCDKGTLTIGRNQCKAKKQVFAACTRSQQCLSGRCIAGSCKEAHECSLNADCASGQYCKKGLGNLSRNRCISKKPDWQACTGDDQCVSGKCSKWRPQDGQTSGICYTPSSKSAGSSCKIDLECKTGKCNSNKRCVCKRDSDCGRNQWCDKGLDLKENQCRDKLPKGASCGFGVGIGHRCLSGKCKLGKCK